MRPRRETGLALQVQVPVRPAAHAGTVWPDRGGLRSVVESTGKQYHCQEKKMICYMWRACARAGEKRTRRAPPTPPPKTKQGQIGVCPPGGPRPVLGYGGKGPRGAGGPVVLSAYAQRGLGVYGSFGRLRARAWWSNHVQSGLWTLRWKTKWRDDWRITGGIGQHSVWGQTKGLSNRAAQ